MGNRQKTVHPTIWGGIECTINRIGDEFKDQLVYSGHYHRPGDIAAIAALGIKTIRYPVLWEKHQTKKELDIDWRWTDQQLSDLQDHGIRPIVGLLHHGSGPSFTNLLDLSFPHQLAAYAYEVANRYPWIEYYTPVNEPLTTARFSGLYGLWYPHHNNECSFYKMLLNQLKGVVLSMEAIRAVNPHAKLVQTEDLGKTHSTPLLSYQAKFENDRRLLTFDILMGWLRPGHPQYDQILGCGIASEDLAFFETHVCPPDILGLNYYITSERCLDEQMANHDRHTHGGNGSHQYADTEMVRVDPGGRIGLKGLAMEMWNRYGIAMAVTEAHLHCTREEQLRWLKEIWDDAVHLAEQGVNIQGVTAWALLGSFDWDTLLTKTGSQYESGVFDIKTYPGQLRPTALARLIRSLVTGMEDFHPVLSAPGWWTRLDGDQLDMRTVIMLNEQRKGTHPPFDTTGLSALLLEACRSRRIACKIVDDLSKIDVSEERPWAIINLGQYNELLDALLSKSQTQYVRFSPDNARIRCLTIELASGPLSVHQVNKMLDLTVDDEEGYALFNGDQPFFVEEYKIEPQPVAQNR